MKKAQYDFPGKIYWRGAQVLLLVLAVLAVWCLGGRRVSVGVSAIPDLLSKSEVCEINSQNDGQFYIYGSNEQLVRHLGAKFCRHAVIGKIFGSVKAFWGVSDENTLQLIGNGIADLVLVKESFMNALQAEQTYGYQKIAVYPDYKAYFISLVEKPVITKEYLMDKTIALVDYPTSRSAHIIPKQVLTRLGLSMEKMHIVYASSHLAMRNLLLKGEVDLISSYWGEEDEERFYRRYITEVADEITGVAWYLKMARNNHELLCTVQAVLVEITGNGNRQYYNNLNLLPQDTCSPPHAIKTLVRKHER